MQNIEGMAASVDLDLDAHSMGFLTAKPVVEERDTAIIYVKFGEACAIRVQHGQILQMRFGALRHEFLIGKPYGSKVMATKGYVYVLRPTPELWTQTLPHRTQILYTPDISLAILLMELRPGKSMAEAGTGSGAMSHALVRSVAPTGFLHSFDIDEHRVKEATRELREHGFGPNIVSVEQRDVCKDGFGLEDRVDALFLDVPNPWEALGWAKKALKSKSDTRFVSFSPCIEQVQRTCEGLRAEGFRHIETMEVVPRSYRVFEQRLEHVYPREEVREVLTALPHPTQQPTHTGYLTAATAP